MFINRALKQCLIVTPLALAMGCGGSSKSAPTAASTTPAGNFSLAITDGPVDSATKVVVEFTGVSLKPVDGEVIEFTFDEPVSIDLLTLQGQVSQYILAAESIPAGDYEWVRLAVNAELDDTMDSYLELNDGTQLELSVPSGAETGLKLVSGFTVPEEGDADFTVDFDLRKSVVVRENGDVASAMLKPALRIVDTISAGSIEGEIAAETVAAQCANAEVNSGAVYVFTPGKGHSDVRGSDADPIASALVKFDDGAYRYELGFVPEGNYQVAFTCDAALDDPEAEDQLTFVDVSREHVRVTVGENVIVDFVPGETLPNGGPVPGADKAEGGKPEVPGKPEQEAPEGETPEVEAPGKPAVPGKPPVSVTPELPDKPEAPEAEAPEMEEPEAEVPETETPEAETPVVDTPEVETPAPAKPMLPGKPENTGKPEAPGKPKTPEVEVPELEVPEVEVPEVELPEVEVPEVEVPGVDLPEVAVPGKGREDKAPKGNGTDEPAEDEADEEELEEVEEEESEEVEEDDSEESEESTEA